MGFHRTYTAHPVQTAANLLGNSASTVALFAVGIGLAKYKLSTNLGFSLWITLLKKLGVQPLIVLVLCQLIGLGPLETKATCLMACLPVGVNVYIMSQEFNVFTRRNRKCFAHHNYSGLSHCTADFGGIRPHVNSKNSSGP